MTIHYTDDLVTVHHGDCLDVLRELPDCSVDAVVTDPPYGISFMGKEWDAPGRATRATTTAADKAANPYGRARAEIAAYTGDAATSARAFQFWCQTWAAECLRVLKPGGHMLTFGGTRTWHRLACAVEDAGFEIRDSIAWLYGSGFPKSLDVSKAIDKAAGAERDLILAEGKSGKARNSMAGDFAGTWTVAAPATPDAQKWQGWGTALKPAHEPVVVARKPLAGTVAGNVLAWGTGALNIDGCRVGTEGEVLSTPQSDPHKRGAGAGEYAISTRDTERMHSAQAASIERTNTLGRWPANVILDPHTAAELDRQSGTTSSNIAEMPLPNAPGFAGSDYGGDGSTNGVTVRGFADSGGASRFFKVVREDSVPGVPLDEMGSRFKYVAKAPTTERPRVKREGGGDGTQNYGGYKVRCCDTCQIRSQATGPLTCGHEGFTWVEPIDRKPDHTAHPTVKPLDLMRYLVRLVTPPGGVVLDPFAGSGTTAEACIIEGFQCITIEREADYLPLIVQRLTKPIQPDLFGGAE